MPLPPGDADLVQIVNSALAEAARRAGPWLVCHPGCTPCCHGAFSIHALDAERLRTGMRTLRATNPAAAQAIEARARAWLAEYAADFPGDPATGILGTSEEDQEKFEEFANDAACPALDPATGLCGVYEWRPMTCRVFGPPVRMANPEDSGQDSDQDSDSADTEALGHCELCFHGATAEQVAACEMPVPHELESELLNEIESQIESSNQSKAETVVAYALLP